MSAGQETITITRKKLYGGMSQANRRPILSTTTIFIALLILADILVINIKIGLLLLIGAALFTTVLLKPKYVYYILISLFSIEGFSAFDNVSYPKLAGILLIAGLSLKIAMRKEALPADTAYPYFFAFFAGSVVSFAMARSLSVSISIYIVYISLFFLYLFTRYFLKSIEDIKAALNYIFVSTLAAFVFVQAAGLSVRGDHSIRLSSGIGDPNAYAAYILVLMSLVIYRIMNCRGKAKIFYLACLVCFLFLFVMTESRGGVLGFIGMSGILIYYYSIGRLRQLLLFSLIVSLIAVFFVPDAYWARLSTIIHPSAEKGASISYRIQAYKAALHMFLDYPLAGVGLYNFKLLSSDYGSVGGKVVHDMYLEILTGGGLLSFVPFVLILINCWRKLNVKIACDKETRDLLICLKAAFVSFLITSIFLSADHEKIHWFLLALCSSAFYIALSQRNLFRRGIPA